MTTLHIRPQADQDVDAIADHIAKDNLPSALTFLEAVRTTFLRLSEHPGKGSLRYATAPTLRRLRVWPVSGFSTYLIFYLEQKDSVEIVRVVHGARDISLLFSPNDFET